MRTLTQFLYEACNKAKCKRKNIKDIINDKKKLVELNKILGESLCVNESNSQDEIDKFKLWIYELLEYEYNVYEGEAEVGYPEEILKEKIEEFNKLTHSHLKYDKYLQEITDKFAAEINDVPLK